MTTPDKARGPSIPADSPADSVCETCPKLYATICYVRHPSHPKIAEEDRAFARAGATFLRKMKENAYATYVARLDYGEGDMQLEMTFFDEASFTFAWNFICTLSGTIPLYGLGIFSHHGVSDGPDDDGAAKDLSHVTGWNPSKDRESWATDGYEVAKLTKMNWIKGKSFIFFAACNADDGDVNIAKAFHHNQGVQVFSSRAFSYFSESYLVYKETSTKSKDMYLLAFARGVNLLRDVDTYVHSVFGGRIMEQIFE